MIRGILIISLNLLSIIASLESESFKIMNNFQGIASDDSKIENQVDSLGSKVGISLRPSRKTLNGKLTESGEPINMTVTIQFTIDRVLDREKIVFKWTTENDVPIDNKFELSDKVNFHCEHTIIMDKDDPLSGTAKFIIFNIDKPFSQLINALAIQKLSDGERIKNSSSYYLKKIKLNLTVRKVFNTIPMMQYERPKILHGDSLEVNVTEVLSKAAGKLEIVDCSALVKKKESHSLIYLYKISIAQDKMYLKDNESTFVLKTEFLPPLEIELTCDMTIDVLNDVSFVVNFSVRNLVIKIVDSFIRCAISELTEKFELVTLRKNLVSSESSGESENNTNLTESKIEVRNGTYYCISMNENKTAFLYDYFKINNGTQVMKSKLRSCDNSEPQKMDCERAFFLERNFCCEIDI